MQASIRLFWALGIVTATFCGVAGATEGDHAAAASSAPAQRGDSGLALAAAAAAATRRLMQAPQVCVCIESSQRCAHGNLFVVPMQQAHGSARVRARPLAPHQLTFVRTHTNKHKIGHPGRPVVADEQQQRQQQ
jgi:hypothetical protein